MSSKRLRGALTVAAVTSAAIVSACSQSTDLLDDVKTSAIAAGAHAYSAKDKECMTRVMFFESHRSSRDGMVAVGTVVMNRLDSGQYPKTVCGVVGQKNQFAPGVMTRKMNSKALPDVQQAAEAVLRGERHPGVKSAKFFHQARLTFPYKNMHYVLEAGGNAFYEKRSRREQAARAVAEAKQVPAETATNALSYDVGQDAADQIGAMLARQKRPAAD